MKNNDKITLSFGQLKRLIKESSYDADISNFKPTAYIGADKAFNIDGIKIAMMVYLTFVTNARNIKNYDMKLAELIDKWVETNYHDAVSGKPATVSYANSKYMSRARAYRMTGDEGYKSYPKGITIYNANIVFNGENIKVNEVLDNLETFLLNNSEFVSIVRPSFNNWRREIIDDIESQIERY